MRILVYMPNSRGGIADYAHDQANALYDLGVQVEMLNAPGFGDGREVHYSLHPELEEPFPKEQSSVRIVRRLRLSQRILQNADRLARVVEQGRYEYVLMHFSEYLAPLWAPRLCRLAARGVTFGSILHDPVRDYVVGPQLWHERSVRQAFSFLTCVFVHADFELPRWTGLKSVVIPYGVHCFPRPDQDRTSVRRALNIQQDAIVLLAFGHIRDGKNLNLVLKAVSEIPELYLIVAGGNMGGGNKPGSHYAALAEQLGCGDRCRWRIRFIDAAEMAGLYNACDLSVLTYSGTFRSASSSLSGAANYRLPCIASSGPGSLEEVVKRYNLGIWVEPDSTEAIKAGLLRWLETGTDPDWERYFAENSWAENARLVIAAMTRAAATVAAGSGKRATAADAITK